MRLKSRLINFLFLSLVLPFIQSLNAQTVLNKSWNFDGREVYKLPGMIVNGLAILGLELDPEEKTDISISPTEASFMLNNGYLTIHDFRDETPYMNKNHEIREGAKLILRNIEMVDVVLTNLEATVSKPRTAPFLLGVSFLKRLGKYEVIENGKRSIKPAREFKAPSVQKNPMPHYTKEAEKALVAGVSSIQAIVYKNGTVGGCTVLIPLGYGLDEASMNIITTKWRFKPGTFNGVPVDVQCTIKMLFRPLH
jgi:hypothetical protein